MPNSLQTEPPSAPTPVAVQVACAEGEAEEPPSAGPQEPPSAPSMEFVAANGTVQVLDRPNRTQPHRSRPATPNQSTPRRRKARRLALVCNMKPPTGAVNTVVAESSAVDDDEFEEFDSPATIQALASHLSAAGYAVTVLEADRTLPRRLTTGNFDLVFNIAEGRGGRCREALVPALCEMLGIAYTGSDPLTLAATLDKAVAKRLVSTEVATPKWRLVRRLADLRAFDLTFPVFAKPNDEGSSKGIFDNSRCESMAALESLCLHLLDTYGRPVLVEEFVRGHEVTVGIVGNHVDGARAAGNGPEVVGMMHVVPMTGAVEDFVYSLEVKRDWQKRVRYAIPPELPAEVCLRIEKAALAAFRLLDCRDVARIDFRVTADGEPFFIEANPLPGLSPTSGDLVLMAGAMGWTWDRLITRIVQEAEFRQGVLRPMLVPAVRSEVKRKPITRLDGAVPPLLQRMLADTSIGR